MPKHFPVISFDGTQTRVWPVTMSSFVEELELQLCSVWHAPNVMFRSRDLNVIVLRQMMMMMMWKQYDNVRQRGSQLHWWLCFHGISWYSDTDQTYRRRLVLVRVNSSSSWTASSGGRRRWHDSSDMLRNKEIKRGQMKRPPAWEAGREDENTGMSLQNKAVTNRSECRRWGPSSKFFTGGQQRRKAWSESLSGIRGSSLSDTHGSSRRQLGAA